MRSLLRSVRPVVSCDRVVLGVNRLAESVLLDSFEFLHRRVIPPELGINLLRNIKSEPPPVADDCSHIEE
jgi:hypothetical protein